MKKFLFVLLIILPLFYAPYGYKKVTHGFRVEKLNLRIFPREEWETPTLSIAEKKEIDQLLCQTFTYLNRGMQSYVFQSEDGTAVIKLFKRRLQKQIEKTFRACHLAYSLVREETGLLYVHLNQTQGQLPTIRLKDRIGRIHHLRLDPYSFVIQKKVESFNETLLEAIDQGVASPLVDSYLEQVSSRIGKGICNTDQSMSKNFGFHQGQAYEIDFGNYIYAPEKKREEFDQFAARMRSFLEKHSPGSLEEYEKKVEAIR